MNIRYRKVPRGFPLVAFGQLPSSPERFKRNIKSRNIITLLLFFGPHAWWGLRATQYIAVLL